MEYLIRFSQWHETFRLAEIQAIAKIEGIEMSIVDYTLESPFSIVKLPSEDAARRLMSRCILAQSIHELWGHGDTLDDVHAAVKANTPHLWPQYADASFKIAIDAFQGSRSSTTKLALINSFSYLPLHGPILMSSPSQSFTIFELWPWNAVPLNIPAPTRVYFGRLVQDASSARDLCKTFDLKKRGYISTTSMDSELALVTANIALAAPGKLFYDPFVGTGSFPIACARFGALGWGSDIDGRAVRGDEQGKSLKSNFEQYGLTQLLGDVFTSDLTNSPVRRNGRRFLDGIVCDPPYGVREGLRVLGVRDPEKDEHLVEKGKKYWNDPQFVPPKKPYSFMAMLDDILQFAVDTLVDDGRLSFWMPTANDQEQEISVPTHPFLEVVVVCTQSFNKWSRRLITYRRKHDSEVDLSAVTQKEQEKLSGTTADDLNPFRRNYFKGFKT